uniref:Little elongation complex subunit 1 C-terminal domain-containing protein n=1 Tax=Sphenodon punctatus TaxID=8508 RepID=A0A8D0HAQ4_SPHPU
MLQKIAPLEKSQEELGSVKAELEEKKSSLKMFQESHLEYVRVKEDIGKSDAAKKKLEAKVKKLEETATKHIQDFKQLKTEKKVLERELKKAQEKIDSFPKQKRRKALKNAETQSEREESAANIHKEKIKLLLEELWMCIDSTTGKNRNQENDYFWASFQGYSRKLEKANKFFIEETAQNHRSSKKQDGKMSSHYSSPETAEKRTSLPPLQIKVDSLSPGGDQVENKATENSGVSNSDGCFYEDNAIEVVLQTDLTDSSSDFSDQEFGGNLLDVLEWARPLPPLLSPIQFSPSDTQDTLFGKMSDSSDEEIDQSARIVETILGESEVEIQSNTDFTMEDEREPPEKASSEDDETQVSVNALTEKSRFAEARDAELAISSAFSSTKENHLEDMTDNMQAEKADISTKTTEDKPDANEDREAEMILSSKIFAAVGMSYSFQHLQEEHNKQVQMQKIIVDDYFEHDQERSSDLVEAEKKVETPESIPSPREDIHLQVEKPTREAENVCEISEQLEEDSSAEMEKGAIEDGPAEMETKCNLEHTSNIREAHAVQLTTVGQDTIATVATEGLCGERESESRHKEEGLERIGYKSPKCLSGTEHPSCLMWQCNDERTLRQTETVTHVYDFAVKSHFSEGNTSQEEALDKEAEHTGEHEVWRKEELENIDAFRSAPLELVSVAERAINLCTDGALYMPDVCEAVYPVSAGGNQLRTIEHGSDVNETESEQKNFVASTESNENLVEIDKLTKSPSETEVTELTDITEEGRLQAVIGNEQNNVSKPLLEKPDFESLLTSTNPKLVIENKIDLLECTSDITEGHTEQVMADRRDIAAAITIEGLCGERESSIANHVVVASEHIAERATEPRQSKGENTISKHKYFILQNLTNDFESPKAKMQNKCLVPKLEVVEERSSEPLETEKTDTLKSFTTESEQASASWSLSLKSVDSCLIAENSQGETKKSNVMLCEGNAVEDCNGNSSDLRESTVKVKEAGNQFSGVTDEAVLEENVNEEPALPTHEISSSIAARMGSETTAESIGFANLKRQVSGEQQSCQSFDETQISAIGSNAASSSVRGDHTNDHLTQSMRDHSLGDLVKGEETVQDDLEKIECKQHDCHSNEFENKNEMEVKNDREQSATKEPTKPIVNAPDICTALKRTLSSVEEEASAVSKASCQDETSTVCLSSVKDTASADKLEPLSSESQLRSLRTNSANKCPSEATMEEESEKLSRDNLPEDENENKISTAVSEIPPETDETEDDDFPLRKVQYVKWQSCSLESREKLGTARNPTADVPKFHTAAEDQNDQVHVLSPLMHTETHVIAKLLKLDAPAVSLAVSCETDRSLGIVKVFSCVTEKGHPKDKLSTTHEDDLHNDGNVERAAVCADVTGWACGSNSLKLESSVLAETSEERPIKETASVIDLLTHQMLAKNSEIHKCVIKNSKLDTSMSASDNWLETNGDEKLTSNMRQSVTNDAGTEVSNIHSVLCREEASDNQEETEAAFNSDCNTNIEQDGIPYSYGDSYHDIFLKKTDLQKNDRKIALVKSGLNPLPSDTILDLRAANPASDPQKTGFEKTCILHSESFDFECKTNNRSKQEDLEPSNLLNLTAKVQAPRDAVRLHQKLPRGRGKTKTPQAQLIQTVLANADTSTPAKYSPKTISKIRQEMGPPLPPLLAPLLTTPPRAAQPVSPVMSSSSWSSLPSPLDDLISPLRETPVPPLVSPLSDAPKYKSPLAFTTPSPSETSVGQRTLSSPLQFCAATPKHALPVPGRLPPSAAGSAAPSAPQENSVKILDTMYPELSARARTLNILKGNIQLNRCALLDCKNLPRPVSQISGFKAIASTSTAFVKTGSNPKSDEKDQQKDLGSQQPSSSLLNHSGKRTSVSASMPRSAKRLRLDSESPKLESNREDSSARVIVGLNTEVQSPADKTHPLINGETSQSTGNVISELSPPIKKIDEPDSSAVILALKKIAESCFDLTIVIQSHVHVGNISKVPVMRNEEKDVVYEFGIARKHLAEPMLHAILNKLKTQKMSLDHNYIQALCRVYVGICRQLGDLEKARLFCYSLLKEDFPECDKLMLFLTNVWYDIISFEGVINKAMLLVIRHRAKGEVLNCLCAYLNWDKSPPLDIGIMVSSLLLAIQLCPKLEFQLSEQYGEDLSEGTWEYIFAIELLCSHQKWLWTHDNIISKELWPIMDKWVKHRKGHANVSSTPDTIVASTLRLIGQLGQIGLKEGFFPAVKNISSVIGLFIQQAREEGVPWGVQLAAVYALCDLGPSNPSGILEAIEAWKTVTRHSIPPAVTSAITEISCLCMKELN